MAENSKIQWTTHTFNAWLGCTKVSPACDHCYAESWAKRAGKPHLWAGERQRTTEDYWRQPIKWNKAAQAAGERHRVFCASLADVFDNQVPEEWRDDLWRLVDKTPHLDWMLLTKRPQNIRKMLPELGATFPAWPWPNVWLGTTVENQEEADRRTPLLLATPAAVRFLSCEPLLGPVDLRDIKHPLSLAKRLAASDDLADAFTALRPVYKGARVDLVIVGGESGPHARPYHYEWAQDIITQCRAAGVACFHKQVGAHPVDFGQRLHLRDKKGGDPAQWPEPLRVREMPA